MPKVSVIIPVYNMEKYIASCLDSVLRQTLDDIEIIIINDGSNDDSLKIIKEYQKVDSRIIVIDKENAGVGAARNDGIKAATGEFVSFMDPDDMFATDDVLFHCYNAAVKENVAIAGGRTVFLYEDGTSVEEYEKQVGNISVKARGLMEYSDYQYDYGYVCYIYKRDLLLDNQIFFPLYSRFQDPPFFVRAMIAAKQFYVLDERAYLYRQLPGTSKLTAKKTIDFLHGIIDNLQISKEYDLSQLHYITAERLKTEGSYMISHNLDSKDINEILSYAIKATAAVDIEWLKKEGFLTSDYLLPEVFTYVAETAVKYERVRKNKFLRVMLGIYFRVFNRR